MFTDSNMITVTPRKSSLDVSDSEENNGKGLNVYDWDQNKIMLRKYGRGAIRTRAAHGNEMGSLLNSNVQSGLKANKSADIKSGNSLNSMQLKDEQLFENNKSVNKSEKDRNETYEWKSKEVAPRKESVSKSISVNLNNKSNKIHKKKIQSKLSFSSFLYKPRHSYGKKMSETKALEKPKIKNFKSLPILEMLKGELNVNHTSSIKAFTETKNKSNALTDVVPNMYDRNNFDSLKTNNVSTYSAKLNLNNIPNSEKLKETLQSKFTDNKNELKSENLKVINNLKPIFDNQPKQEILQRNIIHHKYKYIQPNFTKKKTNQSEEEPYEMPVSEVLQTNKHSDQAMDEQNTVESNNSNFPGAQLKKKIALRNTNDVLPEETNKNQKGLSLEGTHNWNIYPPRAQTSDREQILNSNEIAVKYLPPGKIPSHHKSDFSFAHQDNFNNELPSSGKLLFPTSELQQETEPINDENYIPGHETRINQLLNIFSGQGSLIYNYNTKGKVVHNGQFLHLNNIQRPVNYYQRYYDERPPEGHGNMKGYSILQLQNSPSQLQLGSTNQLVNQFFLNNYQSDD